MQSVDDLWRPVFIKTGQEVIRKGLELKNLSIYTNTRKENSKFVDCSSLKLMEQQMEELVC